MSRHRVGVLLVVLATLIGPSASAVPTALVTAPTPDPASNCRSDWPEPAGHGISTDIGTTMKLFATWSFSRTNFSTGSWSNFTTPTVSQIPFDNMVSGITVLSGDAWAAGTASSIYASDIAPRGLTGACLGVAVTTASGLESNKVFDNPSHCLTNPPTAGDDNPTIAVSSLWSVFYGYSQKGGLDFLYSAANCQVGTPPGCCIDAPCDTPGPGGVPPCAAGANEHCQITRYTQLLRGGTRAVVDVNPCTGHALLARVADYNVGTASGTLYGQTYNSSGTLLFESPIMSMAHKDQVGCTNGQVLSCSGAGCAMGCDDTFPRPQIRAKKRANGHCYAYVAWDYTTTLSGPQNFYKSRMYVYDLGTQAAPNEVFNNATNRVAAWQSTSDSFAWNQWKPQLIVNDGTSNNSVGYFWYSDNLGKCKAYFEGHKDANGATASLSATGQISGQFPVQENSGEAIARGMGEYQVGVKNGLGTDTHLYPMYFEWLFTTATCNSCTAPGGNNWSPVVKVAQVTP